MKRFGKKQNKRVDIEQRNNLNVYNKSMGEVDSMDQNTAAYIINLRSKKWWLPLIRFLLDVSVNNTFQLYRMRNLDQREKRLDAPGFRRAIVDAFGNFINKQLSLHYTLVIDCCTMWQKIFDTITVDTGLSKGHKEDLHYMDAKEHESTFAKNVTLDCIQTVLKHTKFLKYNEYKRLYNGFCINFVFVVVCINKSYD